MNRDGKEVSREIISIEEYLDKRRQMRETEKKRPCLSVDRTWSAIQIILKCQN